MFELKGKYSEAIIYGNYPEGENPPEIGQIISMLNSPAITNPVRIMPDFHYGKGSCVGFTMKAGEYIIPNIVGVDIGCGMKSFKVTENIRDIPLEEINNRIRRSIPLGFSIHQKVETYPVGGLTLEVAEKVGMDINRLQLSLGTLGGGNHFIELGVDLEGNFWFTIHTGSRNFGKMVAEYWQKEAVKFSGKEPNVQKDLEFVPKDNYLIDMYEAQKYAMYNRDTIMSLICESMDLNILDEIDCIHNYINPEDNIIRKGAVEAYKNSDIILPFNRTEGIWIMKGKENEEWNFSSPHGAGRRMSRGQAKRELDPEKIKRDLEIAEVFSSFDPLDEAPQAYKNPVEIKELVQPTAEFLFNIKPILNVKG